MLVTNHKKTARLNEENKREDSLKHKASLFEQ